MPRFFFVGCLLPFLLAVFLSHTGGVLVQGAKVSDLTPRLLNHNAIAPRFHRVDSPDYSLGSLKRSTKRLLDRCAETPIATCLATSCLLLSSGVWLGVLRPESLVVVGMPRTLSEVHLPLTSVLLLPDLNGTTAVNLLSFYLLLRQAESTSGSRPLLKRVLANLLAVTAVSGAFKSPADFHKFSRAVTVTNALDNPDQVVQFQGLLSLKQWHLPLALLLADYLMTLRVEQAVEGAKATVAGIATYLVCNSI